MNKYKINISDIYKKCITRIDKINLRYYVYLSLGY
jgi:hypothetical protein